MRGPLPPAQPHPIIQREPILNKSFFQRLKVPHVFVLLISVIFVCSVLTYIIPSGNYEREKKTLANGQSKTVVKPGSFTKLSKHISSEGIIIGDSAEGKASPTSILGFLTAVPRGMEQAADIIFFIFIVGGVFGILMRTGTITALLHKLLARFSDSGPQLTIVLMVVLAIGGSTLGMGEEFIPLVPIFLIVSKELGYDRIYGLALVNLSAEVGFAAATTNPFTVQIAQGIAEVPLGSGILFRLIFLAACLILAITYVLRYGSKIKRDPSKSIMAGDDFSIAEHDVKQEQLTSAHIWIILSCGLVFGLILYAVQTQGWWLAEMGGGFLLMGFIAAAIARLPLAEATKAFVKGMEEMVVAALVVGFAKGIQVVLMDGQIMDSIIYYAAAGLQDFSRFFAAEGMLVFQTFLNFFIPSGSGQAAVTMPLMAPLSDVLGLTRQTAVFAFTCGDGFSNTIVPTSGLLMAMLGLAGVPYEKWLRFVLPLLLQLLALAAIFLAVAVLIGY